MSSDPMKIAPGDLALFLFIAAAVGFMVGVAVAWYRRDVLLEAEFAGKAGRLRTTIEQQQVEIDHLNAELRTAHTLLDEHWPSQTRPRLY